MKKMKYLLALCLILAAASAFAACGNNSNVADTSMVENTQRGGSAADDAGKAGKDSKSQNIQWSHKMRYSWTWEKHCQPKERTCYHIKAI